MEVKQSYDYCRLRKEIKKKYGTETAFAKALGISTVSLSGRFNNKLYFEQNEMIKSGQLLGIQKKDLHVYFFTKKLKKT